MANLKNNTASLQALISIAGSLPMENEYLAELNAANGGTAATTIGAAVDNTEGHANTQEILIEQIIEALNGKAIEGPEPTIPSVEQAVPEINISNSGLITASATQEDGHVSAGTKSATLQLNTQGVKSVTPTTSTQTAVSSGVYTTGDITVAPIPSEYKKVQFASGRTSYTNSEGQVTVNLGFKPDIVMVTLNETYTYDSSTFKLDTAFNFYHSNTDSVAATNWTGEDHIYDIFMSRTSTGFTMYAWLYEGTSSQGAFQNKRFYYYAIKFT